MRRCDRRKCLILCCVSWFSPASPAVISPSRRLALLSRRPPTALSAATHRPCQADLRHDDDPALPRLRHGPALLDDARARTRRPWCRPCHHRPARRALITAAGGSSPVAAHAAPPQLVAVAPALPQPVHHLDPLVPRQSRLDGRASRPVLPPPAPPPEPPPPPRPGRAWPRAAAPARPPRQRQRQCQRLPQRQCRQQQHLCPADGGQAQQRGDKGRHGGRCPDRQDQPDGQICGGKL